MKESRDVKTLSRGWYIWFGIRVFESTNVHNSAHEASITVSRGVSLGGWL